MLVIREPAPGIALAAQYEQRFNARRSQALKRTERAVRTLD